MKKKKNNKQTNKKKTSHKEFIAPILAVTEPCFHFIEIKKKKQFFHIGNDQSKLHLSATEQCLKIQPSIAYLQVRRWSYASHNDEPEKQKIINHNTQVKILWVRRGLHSCSQVLLSEQFTRLEKDFMILILSKISHKFKDTDWDSVR